MRAWQAEWSHAGSSARAVSAHRLGSRCSCAGLLLLLLWRRLRQRPGHRALHRHHHCSPRQLNLSEASQCPYGGTQTSRIECEIQKPLSCVEGFASANWDVHQGCTAPDDTSNFEMWFKRHLPKHIWMCAWPSFTMMCVCVIVGARPASSSQDAGQLGAHHVKRGICAIFQVGAQALLEVLGWDVPLRLDRGQAACLAVQLCQVQCGPVPDLHPQTNLEAAAASIIFPIHEQGARLCHINLRALFSLYVSGHDPAAHQGKQARSLFRLLCRI